VSNKGTSELLIGLTLPLIEILLSPKLLLGAELLSLDLLSLRLVNSLDQHGLILELVA
jgi:hypothetical protein